MSGETNHDYVRKRVPMSEETRQSLLGSEHESSDEEYAPSPPQKRGKSLFKRPRRRAPLLDRLRWRLRLKGSRKQGFQWLLVGPGPLPMSVWIPPRAWRRSLSLQ